MLRFALLAAFVAFVAAFQAPAPVGVTFKARVSPSARYINIISEEETEAILKTATDCAEGECSIDDVAELIFTLKDQQKVLQERLTKISAMVESLEILNQEEERKTDEVRAFVRDMLRVFNNEKPDFFPVGFTGDIGDGPKTAYDVLNPKPWTPKK